mgnify:CR=1 FL=1
MLNIKKQKNKSSEIKDLVLAVTYQCNGRCSFCGIWKTSDTFSLSCLDYKRIPHDLNSVNITGGEPFLRKDLPELIRVISKRAPKAKIIISSNGLSPSLIKKQMEKIIKFRRDIGVAISIDGIGKSHDKLRGFPGGYGLALETIRVLQELGVRNLKIAFTLNNKNISQLRRVYNLSKEMNLEFSLAIVHNSPHFFRKSNNNIKYISRAKAELEWLIRQELVSFSPKKWLRAYFTNGIIKLMEEQQRPLPDYSGVSSLFIDPFGNIYPSNAWNLKLAHLNDVKDWQKRFLNSEIKKEAPLNWMVCTAREAMRENWFKVLWWILKNKPEASVLFFISWLDLDKNKKAWQKN